MLSRAARNAYSWWWASHIRTKQSKWLDQNLQDMEEKVEYILKIITEDGDSFRVRAEQYYRKRPEIVNFVEDTFRGYRALAERYDHLSRDLQSANRTIAIVFPERVQMSFDEEEYEDFTSNFDENDQNKLPTNSNVPLPLPLPLPPKQPKMESVVQSMLKKKSKMPTKMMAKTGLIKIGVDENASKVSKSSGLSKKEAIEEIDKLQKDILGFQTEKEFVRSSYEKALSKYWEIENNINEMHTKISNLQHEFVVGAVMEDKDAQTLMSSSALKMCRKTLSKLKHKQTRYKKEANVEHRRVDEIRKKFEALIAQNSNNSDLKNLEQTIEHVKDKKAKIEELQLKSSEENSALIQKESGHNNPNMVNLNVNDQEDSLEGQITSKFGQKEEVIGKNEEITISEVAEKIEQLVDKIITLETEVISQTAQVMRLRLENDELHEYLEKLEQDNKNLVDESNNMNIKIKRLEEQLGRVQILDQKIKGQNMQLETSFEEASVTLDKLSNDLLIAKPDEKTQEDDVISQAEKEKTPKSSKLEEQNGFGSYKTHHLEEENHINDGDDLEVFVRKSNENDEEEEHRSLPESMINKEQDVNDNGDEDEPNWNLILSHGIEDREKMLLEEYTSTLRNFKKLKKKLNEKEKRNRASSFRTAVQMKILRNSNESKDAEIRNLYEKLKLFETKIGKPMDFELKKSPDLVAEEIEESIILDESKDFELKKDADLIDKAKEGRKELEEATKLELQNDHILINEDTEIENDIDETTHLELKKASDAIDEGTHRIKELVETAHSELKKARYLIDEGTKGTKEPVESTDLVDEGTQRSKDLDETTDFEEKKAPGLIDKSEKQEIKEINETIDHELKKAPNSIKEAIQRRKELGDGVDEAHEVLDIEEEICTEIDDFRKENLELWLRFSTSYHQINRFQDSFHDLLQEIKQVKEKKHEHGKQRHHQHHSTSFVSDIRPLYRHLRDMQTEVILWLEKSGILEDDLQHRLTSLSDIQDELSDLAANDHVSKSEKTTTPLNNYQAAKFQGEVLNMKQENVKVLEELREASERVKTLQIDIEKTLSRLDEELGKMKKSNSSSKVPFRSFLFGAKLKRKHKSSLFTCMSPSLQRQYSDLQALPQPREDS